MIPDFTNEGHLPQGIYTATEDEFLKRFGTGSARRKWLAERLHDLFDLIKSTGKIEHVFVWGSEARVRFNADIFWAKSSIGVETLKIWLDTYQTTKDFKRQGIIEVKLS